jgi:hypothetical protein
VPGRPSSTKIDGWSEGSIRLVDRRGKKAMPTDAQYESMIQQFDNWKKLCAIWRKIQKGDTPGWAAGKAFEYLVLQAF